MNQFVALVLCVVLNANQATLLPDTVVAALSQELSGETAKRNLEYIARQHRMRGSRGFRSAAEHIVKQLQEYGIKDAGIEQFPADGKTFTERKNLVRPGTPSLQNYGNYAMRMEVGPGTHVWQAGMRCR